MLPEVNTGEGDIEMVDHSLCDYKERYENAIQNCNLKEEKIKILELKVKELESQLSTATEQIKNLENINADLVNADESQFVLKAVKRFKPTLTKKQTIAILAGTRKRKVWEPEDISRAFTLRYCSKKAYLYLKDNLKFPLPAISTLQNWANKIDIQTGVLKSVLKIIQIAGRTMEDFERQTVLSFDEMKVSEIYEYFKKNDEVIGPHKYMQVS